MEAQRRKERTEAHLYMNVQVLLEDAFFGYQGNDLFDPDRVQYRYVWIMEQTIYFPYNNIHLMVIKQYCGNVVIQCVSK